jgi:RNA polymerase sigma factor (sigma-70 family)
MANQVGNGVLRAALSVAAAPRLTDGELLAQFNAGDQAAFSAIVRRHTGLVFGVCRRVLPTEHDAEDACQATFLVLARKAKIGRWQSSIANWLYTTARRIASETNRAAARRMKREAIFAPSAPVSALDEMSGREAFAALDEELDKLSAIYREPLVLCYLQGLTRDEAANRLGIPSATLKSQLDRGRKKLADALTKRGIDIGAGLIAVAAASSAGACPPQLFELILATIGGVPSASVAAIAKGAAVNGFALKAKLLVLAAVAAVGTGLGLASMQIAAGPQRPAIARMKQSRTKEDAKNNDKPKVEKQAAKSDEPPKFKPIDPETIAAYEKLGAVYGAFDVSQTIRFMRGKSAAANQLPGFQVPSQRNGTLPKLPAVEVPFGLFVANVSDLGMKELKNHKNLASLRLVATVTDRGLEELADLKNLTSLDLGHTQVTDVGLKEVKDFTLLKFLSLEATNVTDTGMRNLKGLKNLTTLCLYDRV